MGIIYHIVLHVYKLLLRVSSPFNLRAKKWIVGRKELMENIAHQLKKDEKRVWFHAASLGEFEQGRPVMEEIKKRWPELKLVLTFFSPSGYEIRKDYEHADYVFYLPLDTRGNATKFIEMVQPVFAVFIKYEFWRNFLSLLKQKDIPVYLISAIFRENQIFFRFWGKWYRDILKNFNWFFVQNQASKRLLEGIGYKNISVSGDTRFDRVFEIAKNAKSLPIVEKFSTGYFTIVIGSSWKADEDILFDSINKKHENIRYIIAPHEIHESNIQRIEGNLKVKHQRYSRLDTMPAADCDVLIIDNIGMLSSIYQYGKIAYIGGGFGSGIHNILEAATFGLPVIFGPNYRKYQEAVDLVNLGGAFAIKGQNDVKQILSVLVNESGLLYKAAGISRKYVIENQGACAKITDFILSKYGHMDLLNVGTSETYSN
jgi:3-deoxy-D-manno-octulosonic-acid transferase